MTPSRLTGEPIAQNGGERRLDPRRLGDPGATSSRTDPDALRPNAGRVSDQLEQWLKSDRPHTIGSLIELFEEKSFAILFVLLLGVPALPLPTGGATHAFEIIAVLLALQLVVSSSVTRASARARGMSSRSSGTMRLSSRSMTSIASRIERRHTPGMPPSSSRLIPSGLRNRCKDSLVPHWVSSPKMRFIADARIRTR